MSDLRVALGIEEWNLYGVSYGTDLGLTVLRDHPAGIRSAVLDSVVPPNISLLSEFWVAAASGFRALFDGCAAQPTCAVAYPGLEAEFTDPVDRLATTPLVVPAQDRSGQQVQVNIDGYKFANLVVLLVGAGPPGYVEGPALIHQLAHGDGTAVAQLLAQYVPLPGTNSYGLQLGVLCREAAPQTNVGKAQQRAKTALPELSDEVLRLVPRHR